MIREIEYFPTEREAESEGNRCASILYGYSYSFKVYKDGKQWVLDSCRYTSCD